MKSMCTISSIQLFCSNPEPTTALPAVHTPSPAKKRKRDEYELPPIQSNALSTRAANESDLRMAHPEDLHQLLSLASRNPQMFGNMDDLDIDTESPEFKALSPEDQHDLIVALKVRSRQTSHGRLQQMLESSDTALDFSKQQIDLLVKRNSLTQQWLQVTGAGHRITSLDKSQSKVAAGRVASERNREYMLIKSDQPGGGWTLKMDGGNSATDAHSGRANDQDNRVVVSSDEEGEGSRSENDDLIDGSSEFEDVAPPAHSYMSPRICAAPIAPLDQNTQRQQYWEPHVAASIDTSNPLARSGLGSVASVIHLPENIGRANMGGIENGNGSSNGIPMIHAPNLSAEDPFNDEMDSDSMSVLANDDTGGYVDYDGSHSDIAGSVYSSHSELDADLLALYGDYEQLELLHQRQEEEMQKQREREEEAILAMSAQEFLGTWTQLVTQPILEYDPAIRENMRCWLVDEDPVSLQDIAWRANRQLEKQPDLDMSDPVTSAGAIDLTADDHLLLARTRVARLSLISNYLSFALRWRQCREEPQADAQLQRSHAPSAEMEDAHTTSSDGSAQKTEPDIQLLSSTLLSRKQSPKDDHADSSSPVSADRSPSIEILDGHMETEVENKGDTLRKRDLIFAKAELFAVSAATDTDAGEAAAKASAVKSLVRNIDSDTEDDFEHETDERISYSPDVGIDRTHASHALGADGSGSMSVSTQGTSVTSDMASQHGIDGEDDMDADGARQSELMRSEQDEYALFVDKLKAPTDGSTAASRGAGHQSMRAELERELLALRSRVRDNKRDSSGIDSDMVEDARMLLTLFGIPYVTAPMEAEAQCAAMVSSCLVDGMVTDDSDAFLFASSSSAHVYRHFFQKDRFVEMYAGSSIYQDSSLTRRDFVFIAYLLGSDYTVGIKGIGPVLAMEALAEFGPGAEETEGDSAANDEEAVLGALRRFKAWCDAVCGVLPGYPPPEGLVNTPQRRRLANVLSKTEIPGSFPDPRVAHAYFSPLVDESDAKLEWGLPNLDLLRQFLGEKLGWTAEKADETLVPLIRKMLENRASADSSAPGGLRQATLDSFVSPQGSGDGLPHPNPELASLTRSKRIGKAISSRRNKAKKSAVARKDDSKKPLLYRKSLL
ncbi:hypothetical protein GQ54DRAFT_332113 [Martensiomyces pterosporus]|nr:hypothetical protein GQ54DRAFT_332113 [Martensiomyces pterosporus]